MQYYCKLWFLHIITDVNKAAKTQEKEYLGDDLLTTNLSSLHLSRIQHVRDTCIKHGVSTKLNPRGVSFIYSKPNKLAYFGIPKIGSTFLKQMFMILNKGSDKAEQIYSIMRKAVHTKTGGLYKKLDEESLQNVLVLLPTRNPYTRLFSAFIDKVYLPNAVSLATSVERLGGRSPSCGVNANFSDFLRYALSGNKGRILADHYNSPYKALSNVVCKLDNFMLVKQESFSDDVEFALKAVGVSTADFNAVYDMLHDHRADATVPGIVETIYSNSKHYHSTCLPTSVVAKRTWKSFQIQGFLHSDLEFPSHEFTNNAKHSYDDPKYVARVILKYIENKPLSSQESRAQRRKALLDAYRYVDKEIINKIHLMYAMDFEMFQYDLDINSIT